jgi:hypothetical protein
MSYHLIPLHFIVTNSNLLILEEPIAVLPEGKCANRQGSDTEYGTTDQLDASPRIALFTSGESTEHALGRGRNFDGRHIDDLATLILGEDTRSIRCLGAAISTGGGGSCIRSDRDERGDTQGQRVEHLGDDSLSLGMSISRPADPAHTGEPDIDMKVKISMLPIITSMEVDDALGTQEGEGIVEIEGQMELLARRLAIDLKPSDDGFGTSLDIGGADLETEGEIAFAFGLMARLSLNTATIGDDRL